MEKSNVCENLMLIRAVWGMNRKQVGQLLHCTEKQMGYFERGATNIPLPFIFGLEDLTGIPAKRLYYEALTRVSIPNVPLKQTENAEKATASLRNTPPQYHTEKLSLAERVKRLEMKVFGE